MQPSSKLRDDAIPSGMENVQVKIITQLMRSVEQLANIFTKELDPSPFEDKQARIVRYLHS